MATIAEELLKHKIELEQFDLVYDASIKQGRSVSAQVFSYVMAEEEYTAIVKYFQRTGVLDANGIVVKEGRDKFNTRLEAEKLSGTYKLRDILEEAMRVREEPYF